MNRFFKVIWCEALNAYVVAGEFAKGRTKSASMRKLVAVLVAAGMLGAGFVNSVDAAASKGSQQITITDKDTTGATTEIKTIFYIESEWPTTPNAAGGYSSISSWSGHAANNYDNVTYGGTRWEGTNNISLGLFTKAGYALKENADGSYKTFIGTKEIHGQTVRGELGYDFDEDTQYNYATAFGVRTAAANRMATAWGLRSVASGVASTAFGNKTIAKGDYAVAWGEQTKASGNLSTSWGSETLASGISTTAWGSETQATSNNATAWGWKSIATGNQATAWGYESKATGYQSTAFGKQSYAFAANSLAVAGGEVASDAKNGIAIGWYANSTIKDGIALGNGSVTTRTAGDTNAYGKGDSTGNAWVSTSVALAVGKDADVTRQITGVAAGSKDTDAVNVAQLKKLAEKIDAAGTDTVTTVKGDGNYIKVTADPDNSHDYKISLDFDKLKTEIGSDTVTSVSGGDFVNVTNIGTESNREYKVDIDKDKLKAAIDTNTTNKSMSSEFNDGSLTISVTDSDNNKVSTTVSGIASKADVAEVNKQVSENSKRISQLGGRVDKVGAGAAALAALHPMDFDPDDKLSFAAGVGNYNGQSAAALGMFFRPDEKVMFSIGGTMGNGENMVNAGISFALDRTNHISNSRTALAREVIDLRAQVAEMKAMLANRGLSSIDEDKLKLFPDIPENHWAYEYVDKLADAGIIEGYPDGNFNGDRMMSRYEFAAMLYHAMQNGAQLDSKIINEFMPEMGRIRVDRISGKDGDRHKIERVRVNGPRNERDHYGSKLGK
ncbi:S-layer homology domain-containing protein [Phascolarctobacterium sp. Marseille-Q4147]|uniref:YadA-like family protein n=1 Tax=Phascolarctobacterium sp. Marseille-Q4147 TaxID=2823317 RepID=UPI001B326EA9|nr:YadA-like family protein [Phascolarctobacterium sp. Marseille-Q4147]QTV77798.1 S-layer homology domain-containing protein [Phascolarctobacterium sp. Marseille-Q4147]